MGLFDSIQNTVGGAIGGVVGGAGSFIGAPEFGISESFSGSPLPENTQGLAPSGNGLSTVPLSQNSISNYNNSLTQTVAQTPTQTSAPQGNTLGATSTAASQASTAAAQAQALAAQQAAAATAQNASNIDKAQQRIETSGTNEFNRSRNNLLTQANSIQNGFGDAVGALNQSRENIALDRANQIAGIESGILEGLRSGQVNLAAANASDSSAALQLARAYSQLAAQQGSDVANQAALENRDVDQQLSTVERDKDEQLRQLQVAQQQAVTDITSDVENKLLALDEQAQGLDLAGRVQVEQTKNALRQEGQKLLQAVIQGLQQGLQGVSPISQEQATANAQGLAQLGRPTTPTNLGTLGQANQVGTVLQPLARVTRDEE